MRRQRHSQCSHVAPQVLSWFALRPCKHCVPWCKAILAACNTVLCSACSAWLELVCPPSRQDLLPKLSQVSRQLQSACLLAISISTFPDLDNDCHAVLMSGLSV